MRLKYNSYDGTIINLSKERKIIKHEKKYLKNPQRFIEEFPY